MENKETMKLTFAGGAETPTGSLFLIEVGDKKILVDCGLYQGEKVSMDKNREAFPFSPATIDHIFVTHAHLDHVGRIPKIVKEGFKGTIVSTGPTRDMAELIMLDSFGILSKEAARDNLPPLYEEKDVLQAVSLWKPIAYHEKYTINTSAGDIIVELYDAGHILGSSIIVIEHDGKRLALTGDLGNTPSPLMKETEIPENIDYLVMESVYGDRNHEDYSERVQLLKNAILNTIKDKGVLMIPSFSIERTQELIYYFNEMVEHGEIPAVPVYLDSPLGINITAVYKKYETWFNENAEHAILNGENVFSFKGLIKTPTTEESKAINNVPAPKIIIAGSGMSNGGRITHHESRYLPDANNRLLLVGYQAVGTMGRLLQEGVKEVTIHGERIPVRAKVLQIHGFSAHKDSDHLLGFAEKVANPRLKKVFVVLGEPKSAMYLAQRIHEFHDTKVQVPTIGMTVEIV